MQPDQDPLALDRASIRRAFERAAATYSAAAVLPREVGQRMAERLDLVRLKPARVLDAGCGTGDGLGELKARYPDAAVVGVDLAYAMAAEVRRRASSQRSLLQRLLGGFGGDTGAAAVCADVAALPFKAGSFDLVWSNLALHWSADPARVLAEMHRVLDVDGLLMFSCCGPDTLQELRAAFAAADAGPHVHRFADMHDVGDLLVAAGFANPVMDMERLTLTFSGADAMLDELRQLGAVNAAGGRRRTLTGRRRWARMTAALERFRDAGGRLPATVEVVYGHAWKPPPRTVADGRVIVRFDPPRP